MRTAKLAVVATLGLVGLAACATPQSAAPPANATSTASATTPPAEPTTPAPSPTLPGPPPPAEIPTKLGPNGFGPLTLGMTKAEALATGLVAGMTTLTALCGGDGGDGHLIGAHDPNGPTLEGTLVFSATTGKLVAIYAYPGVTTAEGIALGSTYDQVHSAYPAWKAVGEYESIDGHGSTPVTGNAQAHLRIAIADGTVNQLSLDANDQDCYE